MNKTLWRGVRLWACAALLTPALAAPQPASRVAAAAVMAPSALTHHFIWRVSKARTLLYLVGSIHTLNPDDYPLPKVMESAFRKAHALVEEINLTDVDPTLVDREALKLGAYPHGKSLQTELPPKVYQQVSANARKLGIDMQRLDRLQPWLGSIAVLDMQLKQANFNASDGVDHHFADEAQITGKPVIGLETTRYQLELLDRLPAKAQQTMLLDSLQQAAKFDAEVYALIGAWRKGDAAGLNKILQQDFADNPLAYQRLIVDRNRAWFPRLERLARSGRIYFVVVGAAHLVGPDGLLVRFKKAGYRVQQL